MSCVRMDRNTSFDFVFGSVIESLDSQWLIKSLSLGQFNPGADAYMLFL